VETLKSGGAGESLTKRSPAAALTTTLGSHDAGASQANSESWAAIMRTETFSDLLNHFSRGQINGRRMPIPFRLVWGLYTPFKSTADHPRSSCCRWPSYLTAKVTGKLERKAKSAFHCCVARALSSKRSRMLFDESERGGVEM